MHRLPQASVRAATLHLIRQLKRTGLVEKSAMLIIGLTSAALFAFAELADEMMEGDTRRFDRLVLLAFRNNADLSDPIGPKWLEEMMRDFTALGGLAVLTAVTLAAVGFLLLKRKRHVAAMIAGAVASGALLSTLLKWGFDRPRPDLVPHLSVVYTQSFPSGHATLSAIVYLTLGALLARVQTERRVKIYLLSIAIGVTVLVGISRIYLGVHWPTDVLAGWVIGAAWALICWAIMLWLQARGAVEPSSTTGDAVDSNNAA